MENSVKTIIAATGITLFSLFLIWKGIAGKGTANTLLPWWMLVLSGLFMLILPIAYIVALLAL